METSEIPWVEPIPEKVEGKFTLTCRFCGEKTKPLLFLGWAKIDMTKHADKKHFMPGTGLWGDEEAQKNNADARRAHRAIVGTSEEMVGLEEYERNMGL